MPKSAMFWLTCGWSTTPTTRRHSRASWTRHRAACDRLQDITDELGLAGTGYQVIVGSDVERPTVPEPGSLIMLLSGAGLLALGFISKRRLSSRV